MKYTDIKNMINRIIDNFDPQLALSIDQLYTRCTVSSKDASIFFRAFGELLTAGRLEKIANEAYRLKQ